MLTALTIEKGRLAQTLKIVRRVPDPVPRLAAEEMRRLSTGQLLRLVVAAQHEQREGMLLLELAAHFCETNPPRHCEKYRRAVTLDGTRSPFRLRLARRLWETEQYYQAMNEWRSVLGQDPGNIEARLGLARAAAKAGDRAAAAQEYVRILQIVPDQPEARRELARLNR
jgi:thioredoxin-like negative regulator of GroEL